MNQSELPEVAGFPTRKKKGTPDRRLCSHKLSYQANWELEMTVRDVIHVFHSSL